MNINELKQIVKHCEVLGIKSLHDLEAYKKAYSITNNKALINQLNIDAVSSQEVKST